MKSRQWIAFFVSSRITPRKSVSFISRSSLPTFSCQQQQTCLFHSIGGGDKIKRDSATTATSYTVMDPLYSFPQLVDVDCNLWHRDLKSLQNQGLAESNNDNPWNILVEDAVTKANIVAMISPSSTIEEAIHGLDLLRNHPPPLHVKTTVGVHPYHVNDNEFSSRSIQEHKERIKNLLVENGDYCAAVGECGLDASEGFPLVNDQVPWFQMQIEVAQEMNLPLFIHERLAFDHTMKLLEDVSVPIIIHCFTGTKVECKAYIDRGYYISISGYIFKSSNDNCDEVISCLKEGIVPLDKLMIETDAPYMGFTNCRELYLEHNQQFVSNLNAKKRKKLQQSIYPNVPSALPMVLTKVTDCLQEYDSSMTVERVAMETTKTARSFFGL
jgi:TatD DNase family protein